MSTPTREEVIEHLFQHARSEFGPAVTREHAANLMALVANGLETYFPDKKGAKIAKKLRG